MTISAAPPVPIDAAAQKRMLDYLSELWQRIAKGEIEAIHVIELGKDREFAMAFRGEAEGYRVISLLAVAHQSEVDRIVSGMKITERQDAP